MAITAKESTFEPVAEGIHEGLLTGYDIAEDKGFGPGYKLIWTLPDTKKGDDGEPQDIWQFVSQKLSPKSTLWGVLKGCGFTPTIGETYEDDDLFSPCIGVPVNLVIKHVDGPNGPRAKVTDVLGKTKK